MSVPDEFTLTITEEDAVRSLEAKRSGAESATRECLLAQSFRRTFPKIPRTRVCAGFTNVLIDHKGRWCVIAPESEVCWEMVTRWCLLAPSELAGDLVALAHAKDFVGHKFTFRRVL